VIDAEEIIALEMMEYDIECSRHSARKIIDALKAAGFVIVKESPPASGAIICQICGGPCRVPAAIERERLR